MLLQTYNLAATVFSFIHHQHCFSLFLVMYRLTRNVIIELSDIPVFFKEKYFNFKSSICFLMIGMNLVG